MRWTINEIYEAQLAAYQDSLANYEHAIKTLDPLMHFLLAKPVKPVWSESDRNISIKTPFAVRKWKNHRR